MPTTGSRRRAKAARLSRGVRRGTNMAISDRVKRLLWSRSGGFCQNPNCQKDFFLCFKDGSISSIEELAHIIARSNRGPRANWRKEEELRDEYDNIILFCPNCHSLIDKNPSQFPVDILKRWKSDHETIIKDAFVVPTFEYRKSLANRVHSLLNRNKQIFKEYGPHSKNSDSLLTDASDTWIRYIHSTILPNNRKIGKLLLRNEHLLNDHEKSVLQEFIIHQEAFEYNHISGDKTASAPTFPTEMVLILKD